MTYQQRIDAIDSRLAAYKKAIHELEAKGLGESSPAILFRGLMEDGERERKTCDHLLQLGRLKAGR